VDTVTLARGQGRCEDAIVFHGQFGKCRGMP